ncbi:MAG TPA: alpha/beta fold hydrolase [Actinophytocola sp.]|uniref:alpha/beta fold hydrolase n=1 Tax=Actinophytocola sp. TaxID=1872138 RepID=UPI002DB65181|nr:alpha/beta fold hydrolase [Actinophytocola sp.]HEU5470701.1 alpha/beta fold hydrolase [Actinophytocola sp.]
MEQVMSKDGTTIAFDRSGAGPTVILVGGGLDDGTENAALVPVLGRWFTVYNYARRGRGASGDTAPYALEREIEDLDALVRVAGGPAHVFGASSGGALALEAAAAGLAFDRIAVYEVPYATDAEAVRRWAEYTAELAAVLAENRRDEAIALFMRLAGSSDEEIAGARASTFWPGLTALAPTLAYDAACLGDGRPPADRLATVRQPVLVATGGRPDPHMSGLQPGFFDEAADAITAALPNAERRIVEGVSHVADPERLGAVLGRFYTAGAAASGGLTARPRSSGR